MTFKDFASRVIEGNKTHEIPIGRLVMTRNSVEINGATTNTIKVLEIKVFDWLDYGSLLEIRLDIAERVGATMQRPIFDVLFTKPEFNRFWKCLNDWFVLLRDSGSAEPQRIQIPNSDKEIVLDLSERLSSEKMHSYIRLRLLDNVSKDEVTVYLNLWEANTLLNLLLASPLHLRNPQ